jgi:hypothetical protein
MIFLRTIPIQPSSFIKLFTKKIIAALSKDRNVGIASPKKCTRNGRFTSWNKEDGDIPQGEGYGVSSPKYGLSEETGMGLTMKEKQAVTKQLALTYKRAGKKEKGKIKEKYETCLTPFEKFQSLLNHEQFLKEGVTLEELEQIARSYSDTEYAKLVQEKKAELFRSFSKPGILT